jgi:hypothetical protein
MTVPEDNQFRPRATVYKGVRMRSRLEASVAAFLDREDLPWTYEPSAFADERGQYLPDFRVGGLTVELPLYVDVKGRALDDDELAATFDLMATIWASEAAVLAIWTADAFGIEGAFRVRLPDGRELGARIRRCGPCGGVTLRSFCPICGRTVVPISPLLDVRNPAA